MKNMLQDKVILITGSSRGIGAATARLAKRYGAHVILHGRKESDQLKNLAHELESEYIVCDVSDKKAAFNEVEKVVGKFGRIDALINNAGYYAPGTPFLESQDDQWTTHYKVNTLGVVHFCQATIPGMQKEKKGRIVNVASLSAVPEYAKAQSMAYAVSKGALLTMTGALAKEAAPHIGVNAVLPGGTETDMAEKWSPEARALFDASLVGRPADPTEIAEVILFLASDRARYITAQNIIVDGGLLARE